MIFVSYSFGIVEIVERFLEKRSLRMILHFAKASLKVGDDIGNPTRPLLRV
jgi:hypothetical protein